MKYLTRMQFRVRSGKKRKGRRGVWMIKSKTKYEATLEEIKELFAFHKLGNVVDMSQMSQTI